MEREPQLSIKRWQNVYSVATDFPAPEELRSRLDRLVARDVADACRRGLTPFLESSDPSVWLIREIQIELAVDAGHNALEQAGIAWGEQLALEIRHVLQRGPQGGSVIRFADRAAWVAQWVRDMASGCAWDKWYYAEFASLRSLPQGAAIVEGIVRERELTKEILCRLHAQGEMGAVLGVMTNANARRIYEGVLPLAGADNPGRWTARLLAVWKGIALSTTGESGFDALRLFAAAAGEWPDEAEDPGLRRAIDGLLELRRLLPAFGSREIAQRFLHAAAAQHYEPAREILAVYGIDTGDAAIAFVSRASGGDAAWGDFAASVVGSSELSVANRDESFVSELGGVFLLGASFSHLYIQDAVRAAAKSCADPMRAEAALLHLLAVRCMGRARATLGIGDAAIRLFAQVDGKMSLSGMAEALAGAEAGAALRTLAETMVRHGYEDPAAGPPDEHRDYFAVGCVFPELQLDEAGERAWASIAAAILKNFARRLPGFAHSSPEYLFQNFLRGSSFIRAAADRIEVRLPQSPLSIVLRIAGAYRTLTLPWHEGVEVCLLAPAG